MLFHSGRSIKKNQVVYFPLAYNFTDIKLLGGDGVLSFPFLPGRLFNLRSEAGILKLDHIIMPEQEVPLS